MSTLLGIMRAIRAFVIRQMQSWSALVMQQHGFGPAVVDGASFGSVQLSWSVMLQTSAKTGNISWLISLYGSLMQSV